MYSKIQITMVDTEAHSQDVDTDQESLSLQRPIKKYECDICGFKYVRKQSLVRHKFFHTSKRECECPLCKMKFKEHRLLAYHYRRHTGEDLRTIGIVHFCAKCGLGYQTEEERLRHEKGHIVKEKNHTCEICGKKFTTRFSLKMHYMIHTGERPFVCETCGLGFIKKSLLDKHGILHSGNTDELIKKCDVCGKTFQSSGGLSNHFAQKHSGRTFPCEICGKVFPGKQHLKQHNLIHTGEKKHVCEICGKAFTHKSGLTSHCLTHTVRVLREKPYSCDVCGKSFQTRGEIYRHFRSHAGEKPHKCEVCGKCFAHKTYLRVHNRKHTGEKPYTCSICGIKFTNKNSQLKHEARHSDEQQYLNPFMCKICEMTFKSKTGLSKHLFHHKSSGTGVITENNFHQNRERPEIIIPDTANSDSKQSSSDADTEQKNASVVVKEPSLSNISRLIGVSSPPKTTLRPLRPKLPQPALSSAVSSNMIIFQYRNNNINKNLKFDFRSHAGEKPHKCEVCGKCFAHKTNLRVHNRKHTGEKPYTCSICGIKFTNKNSQQKHEARHSDEQQYLNPFMCKICEMTFKSKTGLSNHLFHHKSSGTGVITEDNFHQNPERPEIIIPDTANSDSKQSSHDADTEQKNASVVVKEPSLSNISRLIGVSSPPKTTLRRLRPKLPQPALSSAVSSNMIIFQYRNNNINKNLRYQPIAPAIPPLISDKNMLTVLVPNTFIVNPIQK